MKDKLILFAIGVLVGAVVATGTFCIYTSIIKSCNSNTNNQITNAQPPQMPSGQNNNNNNGQPPEKPDDNNNTTSNSQDSNS